MLLAAVVALQLTVQAPSRPVVTAQRQNVVRRLDVVRLRPRTWRASGELPAGTWHVVVRVGGRVLRRSTVLLRPALTNALDVDVDANGRLVVGDMAGVVFTGPPLTALASVRFPVEVAFDPNGGIGVISDDRYLVHVDGASVRIVAELDHPTALAYAPNGDVFVSEIGGRVLRLSGTTVSVVASGLASPHGLAVTPDGVLYVCETGANRLLRVTGGVVTVAASDLRLPVDVAAGPAGVFVADFGNNRVARVAADGTVSTVAVGSGPNGVAVHGGSVYFTERTLPRVRVVDLASGSVTTALGR